jgi:hypothetical protein
MHDIKVFQVNDYEWWAGRTWEEVKKAYIEMAGEDVDEDEFDGFELTDEDLNDYVVHDEDGKTCRSFREELENMISSGMWFPCFFATTEY